MNFLRDLVLSRTTTRIEFLCPWLELTFDANGNAKAPLPERIIKPIEYGLLVPLDVEGVPLFISAEGVMLSWSVKGEVLTVAKDHWQIISGAEGFTGVCLVSLPMMYEARPMSALLPAEIRSITSSSAEVMALINAKDPNMVDRVTKAMRSQMKSGSRNSSAVAEDIETAINVELTMRHPELLAEIESLQLQQPAIQLAAMLNGDREFFIELFAEVPGGSAMINNALREIEPPLAPSSDQDQLDTETIEAVVAEETVLAKEFEGQVIRAAEPKAAKKRSGRPQKPVEEITETPPAIPTVAVEALGEDPDDDDFEDDDEEDDE